MLGSASTPALAQSEREEEPATSTAPGQGEETEPSACGTCGTGLVATGLVLTSPITLSAALALLVATQAEWIVVPPEQTYGVPLWAYGLGCAGAHLFLAAISSVAFWRDIFTLCGSVTEELDAGEGDEEIIIEEEQESVQVSAPRDRALAY